MLYEIHITCYTSDRDKAVKVAKQLHWKTSEIARDPVLGNDTYFYLTKYDNDFFEAKSSLRNAVESLLRDSVTVIREKIEYIVYDKRYK